MALPLTDDDKWIACPQCRIANIAASVYCTSCGAVLDPTAPPPNPAAERKHWMLFIGILAFLIGSAIWAGVSPNSIAAKMYDSSIPIFYGLILIFGFTRAFLRFRKGDLSGGIMGVALTILIALAALPTVLDLDK